MEEYSALDRKAAEELFATYYDELLRLAKNRRARFSAYNSMQTQDVLHESYIRVSRARDWQSDKHFLNTMNIAMRHVIIDHARRRMAQKNGGDVDFVPLSAEDMENVPGLNETPEQLLIIADMLTTLETENPRWMKIIDARYFGGMSEEETADLLGVSARTVRRDWRAARQWLALSLGIED